MTRVRAEAVRSINTAAESKWNTVFYNTERSDKMLEYDEYRLKLQGFEDSINDLRDSL